MKILIYGAGVIGASLAADLSAYKKDVTLLARGEWADTIEKKGLIMDSPFSPFKKKYRIPVIRQLKKYDAYDVIFVVMRFTQLDSIIPILNENVSKNIVLVGNNVAAREYAAKLPDKNVMFGFYMAAGRRESDRAAAFSMKKITIGQLKENKSNRPLIQKIFADTKIKVSYQPNMEDYLLCHAAFVIPVGFACYHCDGDLKKIKDDKDYLNQIIDANIEGYQAIENAGHEILPESDQDYHSTKYRKLCYTVYKTMCATKIGRICASDHALNAVEEMNAINEGLKKFYDSVHAEYPVYLKLEQDAAKHLNRTAEE